MLDHPLVPVHLLIFGVEAFVTSLTCLVDMWTWPDRSIAEKQQLTALYGPYVALGRLALGSGNPDGLSADALQGREWPSTCSSDCVVNSCPSPNAIDQPRRGISLIRTPSLRAMLNCDKRQKSSPAQYISKQQNEEKIPTFPQKRRPSKCCVPRSEIRLRHPSPRWLHPAPGQPRHARNRAR